MATINASSSVQNAATIAFANGNRQQQQSRTGNSPDQPASSSSRAPQEQAREAQANAAAVSSPATPTQGNSPEAVRPVDESARQTQVRRATDGDRADRIEGQRQQRLQQQQEQARTQAQQDESTSVNAYGQKKGGIINITV